MNAPGFHPSGEATYISSGDKSAKIPEIYARPGSAMAIIPACSEGGEGGERKRARLRRRGAKRRRKKIGSGIAERIKEVVKGELIVRSL